MNRVIFMVLAVSVVLASGLIGSRHAQEGECVPGELVVFFVDDGQSALSITPSAVSAASPVVDRVLTRHGLVSARALFGPRSRLRNVACQVHGTSMSTAIDRDTNHPEISGHNDPKALDDPLGLA
jgi:hypothetical protein